MNVPGSYPRSKMISELGVTSGGFFISIESKRIMAKMELKTITAAGFRIIVVQGSCYA